MTLDITDRGEETSSRIVVAKENAACIGKLLLQR